MTERPPYDPDPDASHAPAVIAGQTDDVETGELANPEARDSEKRWSHEGDYSLVSLEAAYHCETIEEWAELGRRNGQLADSVRWFLGDWWRAGAKYGDEREQFADLARVSIKTLDNYAAVCSAFPTTEQRGVGVAWGIHEAIAKLARKDPEEGQKALADAKAQDMSVTKAREVYQRPKELTTGSKPPLRDSAKSVWSTARLDGDEYRVPREQMMTMARALGLA